MTNAEIIEKYKASYKKMHGRECDIQHCGGGWYSIVRGEINSPSKYRIKQLLPMSERLDEMRRLKTAGE